MAFNVSEPAFKPIVIEGQLFVIQPKQMQDRGMEVVHGHYIFCCPISKLISGPPRKRSPDSGPSRYPLLPINRFLPPS